MIKNISDLKIKMRKDADDYNTEDRKKRFFLYKKGISDVQFNHLHENLPELPESYTECLKRYNVFGITVGYFSISPINWDTDNIVDSLIKAQSFEESFLLRSMLDPIDVYWIGNNNNDTIYVAGKNSPYEEGEIIAIHEFILNAEEKDFDDYRMPLAKDFEQFLVIAGNLNEVHRLNAEPEISKTEMLQRLNALNVDEKYHESWLAYL